MKMSLLPQRVMIDFETVDTSPRAGILTLGACTFWHIGERQTFYGKASLASNEQLKRTINPATMKWWDGQDEAIRKEAFGGTDAVDDVLQNFVSWMSSFGTPLQEIEIWSRGAAFDCEILQDAFFQIFGSYPFNFRKHMCQRTLQAMMPTELVSVVPQRSAKHISYIDAYNQADIVEKAFMNIRWGAFSG